MSSQHASCLEWPPGFNRTPERERTRNNRFDATLRESIDDLAAELERVGVDDWRLETGAQHQQRNPKYPYANASPEDPGAAVYWTMGGAQYAAACDDYSRLRDNIRSLYLYVHEKRKMEQRPVVTGESEFANARLPPADDEIVTAPAGRSAYEVLEVPPGSSAEAIKAAARARKKETHPDLGGDRYEFQQVAEAEEKLLNDMEGKTDT